MSTFVVLYFRSSDRVKKVSPVYKVPYSLDQTPLSISRRSRIVAAPPEVLNEIVAALE